MNSVDRAIEPAAAPFKMLSGVTVVDLTTSIAGPYATMLLSDFGADVVKVERLGGDDARQWGPPFLHGESLWFMSFNRNKMSVQLDYSSFEGKRVLSDLLDNADVVVTNQLPNVQRKLGLDAQAVRARRPRLIHVSITGFGLSGPNSDLPCYDLIAEGYSGVMDLTGTMEVEPQKVGSPAADMLAGSDAAMAVFAALHRRNANGKGCSLDVSLTESMIRFMSPRIVTYMGSGEVPRRSGGKDSVIAIYQTFETADLPMTLGIGNDGIWKRLWGVFGRPEVAADPRFSNNAERRAHREEIVAMIQEILRARPRAEWLKLFAGSKVPAGPIYRVDEVVEDPHFRARATFYEMDREGEMLPQVGLGINVDGVSSRGFAPPPRLGEHTEDVMRRLLSYDDERIAELRASGAI